MKINKVLLGVIVIGLIVSSLIIYDRIIVENDSKVYEVTLEYNDAKKIADACDMEISEFFEDFSDVKIDSISINEACIDTLKNDDKFNVRTEYVGYDVLVKANKEGINFIEKGLKEVLSPNRKIERLSEETLLVGGRINDFITREKKKTISKLELVGLGYSKEEIENVNNSKFGLRFRPRYVDLQDSDESVDRLVDYVKEYSTQKYVLFASDSVFGKNDNKYFAEKLIELGVYPAMIEDSVQRGHLDLNGISTLLNEMENKAFRVFTTWDFIQKRFDYGIPGHHNGEEIVNTYFRAISERNIRIIYFKPFIRKDKSIISDKSIYLARLDELNERLSKFPNNMKNVSQNSGRILPMKTLKLKKYFLIFSALSLVAALLMVIDNMFKIKKKSIYILLSISVFPTILIYVLEIKMQLFNSLFALASAIIFACLSIIFAMKSAKVIWVRKEQKTNDLNAIIIGFVYMIMCILISVCGSIIETSFFAESKYLLELSFFRGVKISQLLPIGFAFIVSLIIFARAIFKNENIQDDILNDTKIILNSNLKMWHALLGGILVLGLIILLARGGHESNNMPSSFELLFRNFFESTLPARPRTKAILFGYPGAVLLFYFVKKNKHAFLFPLLAVFLGIGQANILNTFSHIRTPFILSLTRVASELVVSIIISIIYILIIKLIEKIYHRFT